MFFVEQPSHVETVCLLSKKILILCLILNLRGNMYLRFCLIERMISLNIIYKKATIEDIVLLTKTRIEVLRAANNLTSDIDMDEVERKTYEYYKEAFQNDTHTAYMVFEDNKFVGAGGVSYYQVMPTYHNPSGKKAYIMNMYTKPLYRRNGIAIRTLALLVEDAKKRGITSISLEATEMGRPLYEKFGFVQMKNEMEYIEI